MATLCADALQRLFYLLPAPGGATNPRFHGGCFGVLGTPPTKPFVSPGPPAPIRPKDLTLFYSALVIVLKKKRGFALFLEASNAALGGWRALAAHCSLPVSLLSGELSYGSTVM